MVTSFQNPGLRRFVFDAARAYLDNISLPGTLAGELARQITDEYMQHAMLPPRMYYGFEQIIADPLFKQIVNNVVNVPKRESPWGKLALGGQLVEGVQNITLYGTIITLLYILYTERKILKKLAEKVKH